MVAAALRGALSDRAASGRVAVVERWDFERPRTKEALATLAGIGTDGRVMLVTSPEEWEARRSFSNLPEVELCPAGSLNTYEVLRSDWVVFSASAVPGGVKKLGEA
jgi:large subunit ribosomal protein L4